MFVTCSASRIQELVSKVLEDLRKFNMALTERELSILSISVSELEQGGYQPFQIHYAIQVAPRLHSYLRIQFRNFWGIGRITLHDIRLAPDCRPLSGPELGQSELVQDDSEVVPLLASGFQVCDHTQVASSEQQGRAFQILPKGLLS